MIAIDSSSSSSSYVSDDWNYIYLECNRNDALKATIGIEYNYAREVVISNQMLPIIIYISNVTVKENQEE